MNKQELIEYCESLKGDLNKFINGINVDKIIAKIEQLDEPQPIKLKDVIVRIKQLDIGTRKVWLDEFLNKLGSDYGLLKYKAGYEQGKFEGSMIPCDEPQKTVVPQFVADWIEKSKLRGWDLLASMCFVVSSKNKKLIKWLYLGKNKYARAWLDGYTVEKEKRYIVKIKGVNKECEYLVFGELSNTWKLRSLGSFGELRKHHTRKELEEAGFGEVFNSPLFEVEEVE